MTSVPYVLILLIGAAIVIIDGQLILRTSRSYLRRNDPHNGGELSVLLSLLFHLFMLGVVALVASIDLGPQPQAPEILRRLGTLFILTAVGHAITILVLSRMRADQADAERVEALSQHWSARPAPDGDGSQATSVPARQPGPEQPVVRNQAHG